MRYSGTACSTWCSLAATSRQEWVLKQKLSPLLPLTMVSLRPLRLQEPPPPLQTMASLRASLRPVRVCWLRSWIVAAASSSPTEMLKGAITKHAAMLGWTAPLNACRSVCASPMPASPGLPTSR
jgi:hypothetical protein